MFGTSIIFGTMTNATLFILSSQALQMSGIMKQALKIVDGCSSQQIFLLCSALPKDEGKGGDCCINSNSMCMMNNAYHALLYTNLSSIHST